jgi:hypothetical protein
VTVSFWETIKIFRSHSLQTLSDFLASAPKTHLAKLYRRDNPDAGLVSGTKVSGAVLGRALDPERLEAVLESLEPEGRRLLLGVYASEERGMLESELVRGCEGGALAAGYWLGVFEYELLALRREGEHRSYHGFRELAPLLFPRLISEFAPAGEPPAQTAWISNASHVASHFCHFLARVARGDLRLTQSGELHRKSLTDLAKGFGAGDMLSDAVGQEEAVFLFRFAVDSDLLVEDEGVLRLTQTAPEWLENGGEELAHRLREWWLRKRARGIARLLEVLCAPVENVGAGSPVRGVAGLAPLFSVYEGWDKVRGKAPSELTTWENMPRLLRELWLLGGAEFAMARGRIRWVRVLSTAERAERTAPAPETARGLPNFEALVPGGIPLGRLFQIELLSVRENDERVTRYRFTKDSVLAGLRSGLGTELLEEVAAWLGFEVPARRVLAEWAATYASAIFRDLFVLRVRDAARFTDLESFPQFMDLVTEVIPGYGFVLPRGARDRARDLLKVFDLQPGDEGEIGFSGTGGRRPVIGEGADIVWSLPVFPHGEAAYRHVVPVRREEAAERERGARAKEETPALRLRALENAIASQRSVEFTYGNGTARVKVQPLHVLRNREPMKLIGVDLASGHRNEYALDQMQALRAGEMA